MSPTLGPDPPDSREPIPPDIPVPQPRIIHTTPTAHTRTNRNNTASIKLAGLNLRGCGNFSGNGNADDKWFHVNQMMRQQSIGILVVGEAHLNQERRLAIESLFERRLRVYASEDPDNTNARGVAIVLNKKLVDVRQANLGVTEIIPGRALLLEIVWHNERRLSILGIYAPNDLAENALFWNRLRVFFESNPDIREPDFMLGDTNLVEDPMDRIPAQPVPITASGALDELKHSLNLLDGWRRANPTTRQFTFHRTNPNTGTQSQSRIDRIYVKNSQFQHADNWRITVSPIRTDHNLVSVLYFAPHTPEVGKGRWAWPRYLLKDDKLMTYINTRGCELLADMTDLQNRQTRSEHENCQHLWDAFTADITAKAKERSKVRIAPIDKEIKTLEVDLDDIANMPEISDEHRSLATAVKLHRLTTLIQRRHASTRLYTQAKCALEVEVISRYWSQLNKAHKPNETILRLVRESIAQPDGTTRVQYETRSRSMAEIAQNHHESLQSQQPVAPEVQPERDRCIDDILRLVRPEARLSDEDGETLRRLTTEEDVREALHLCANYKAPGLNGICYELWKQLSSRFDSLRDSDVPPFDIIACLTKVYNDIELHGVAPNTQFTASWMCPLYKKGDRADIANYRPISLLNTDYKIFTKSLTLRFGKLLPKMVHPDQAGFVPGRHIYDHVWLTKFVIELAELDERDGAIVALDQEKAYDKIKHDYLWRVLEAFNLPRQFISTVQALYSDAKTSVMINGILSEPYHVIRGVRQGDALSCGLFDLAIEPLAEMLRQSNLEGFQIPGTRERLIATLFADDTTVYLSCHDSFETLQSLLDRWCLASGAKFNINKTEVIPVGRPEYRDMVITTRQLDPQHLPVPDGIRIAREGEAIRTLGAWVGNNVSEMACWAPCLEKIDNALHRWAMGHPTMEGRRLINTMIVGGMTNYLAKVQGMPKEIEVRLEKRTRHYIWNEKTHVAVNKETIYAPIEVGGRKVLDLPARNDAIYLTWLRSYLDLRMSHRPKWAFAADAIFARNAVSQDSTINLSLRLNPFLQRWTVSARKLPHDLKQMLKVAKKYGVYMDALAPSLDLMRKLPIWHHKYATCSRRLFSSRLNKCLKTNHRVMLVGAAERLANLEATEGHIPVATCLCAGCVQTRVATNHNCLNPHHCYLRAQLLLDALPPKWNPQTGRLPEDYEADLIPSDDPSRPAFDRRITTTGSLANLFRVFAEPPRTGPPLWLPPSHHPNRQGITAYTDGSATNNGGADPRAGAGIFVGPASPYNRAIRVPPELGASNQIAELLAVKECSEIVPRDVALHIISDSRYAIDGLTEYVKRWEDDGYLLVENGPLIALTTARLRRRTAPTTFEWVKGHSGCTGNEISDRLAAQGRELPSPTMIDTTIHSQLRVTGMSLTALTQSKAYKVIRKLKMETFDYQAKLDRPATVRNVDGVIQTASLYNKEPPAPEQFWRSIRHKDIPKNLRHYLWMTAHGAYKIGSFWSKTRLRRSGHLLTL
jgi:ribonuclease HI/exonuclease III